MALVALVVVALAPVVRGDRASAPTRADAAVTMTIKSDEEHGRLGPEGTWHDVVTNASFRVRPGQRVTVTVVNYDTGPHTFTAPELGVNVAIGAGSLTAPNKVVFKFTAPRSPGTYEWRCLIPCDPWAMTHEGFMRGLVTVAA